MDVRMTNALLVTIDGDMRKLLLGSSFLRCVIFPHEVALLSAEDLSSSFYQLRMPVVWHRYFVFRRPNSGAAVGRPDMKECYLAAVVLPMGFSAAVGIMQSWHRRVMLGQGALSLSSLSQGAGLGLQRDA